MQYIRFLKTPRLKAKAGRAQIAALITVTSDLGESFMLRDSPIIALVRLEDGTVIARREFSWTAGMRSLPIEILVERRPNGGRPVTLQVSANGLSADNLLLGPKSTILSVWSSPLTLNSEDVEDFVERRLDIGRGHHLSVWEETRDSIARHIWDGGIALSTYLARVLSTPGSSVEGTLGTLDECLTGSQKLNVLELGSGCGIVGLALSRLRENCHVTMTDLPLAKEIAEKNLKDQQQVVFQVLDWNEDIPADISSQHFDIIVVADCMYNSDAAPALVSVIAKLLKGMPETTLVIAHKKRHDSEEEFLHLLKESGVAMVGQTRVDIGEEYTDLEPEGVDLYAMQSVGA